VSGKAVVTSRADLGDRIPFLSLERSKWRVDQGKSQCIEGAERGRPAGRIRLAVPVAWMSVLVFVFLLPGTRLHALQEPIQESTQEPAAATAPNSQDQVPTNRVTVQGAVHNGATGVPLPRALVEIEGDAETGTLTDGEGHFELPNVPIGAQTIRVAKPGFRDRPYAAEENGLQSEGPAHSVMVSAQMPGLNFALTPDNAIHGRIELSSGDPASAFTVILLKRLVRFGREVWAMESNARTNGDGAYRFGGLPDGVYALLTQPALESEPAVNGVTTSSASNVARSGYASVFYPEARDLAGASLIRLSGGTQAEAHFSLALEPFYAVTAFAAPAGRTGANPRAADPSAYAASLFDASGQILPYTAQYDGPTRSLQANLPNGNYMMLVHGGGDNRGTELGGFVSGLTELTVNEAGLGVNGGRGIAGAAEFTVSGHPVTGLHIPLGTPQQATVHLRFLHSTDSSNTTALSAAQNAQPVTLNIDEANGAPLNSSENIWSMNARSDAITFSAQPGAYWLSAVVQAKGVCVGSFNAGGANLAREPLTLSMTTAPPPMELTLRDDCGTLSLQLPGALASFLPGDEPFYTVYVVPDFDTIQDVPPMTVHPSSGPTLTVDGLAPGSYHVYSFDSPVRLAYRDPAALAALATAGQQ